MWEVNLQEKEYNKLRKKLEDYHNDEIKNIKKVITDIESLLKNDKYFKVEQTAQNLLALLSVIKTDILPLVKSTFDESEQCIDTLITSFNNIDTLC